MPICLVFGIIWQLNDILSNFSVIAETKFWTLGPFVTTYISDVLLFEPVLCHLSNVSVVSVFADTKFEIPLAPKTTFIIDV